MRLLIRPKKKGKKKGLGWLANVRLEEKKNKRGGGGGGGEVRIESTEKLFTVSNAVSSSIRFPKRLRDAQDGERATGCIIWVRGERAVEGWLRGYQSTCEWGRQPLPVHCTFHERMNQICTHCRTQKEEYTFVYIDSQVKIKYLHFFFFSRSPFWDSFWRRILLAIEAFGNKDR